MIVRKSLPLHELALGSLPSMEMADHDVHVWSAWLDPPQGITRFVSLLSPEEVQRAERFYFEKDRQHFIVGRGLLRILLGNYLTMDPAQIQFDYGAYGKPTLKRIASPKILQFNLSHSNNLAVYIFGWNRLVGVDVECIRSMTDEGRFAEQLFSPSESEFLHSLTGEERLHTFFKIWTCKEAFFKAVGDGLTIPIEKAEISIDAEGVARLASIDDNSEQAANWHLEMFTPVSGYQASLAVEGHAGQIIFHRLDYVDHSAS